MMARTLLHTALRVVFLLAWASFLRGPANATGAPQATFQGDVISRAGETEAVRPWTNNPVHMVVVFTKFQGESPEITEPPEWSASMFDGQPGSVNHYFDTMSFGQIKVTGEVLPMVVELPRAASYYDTGTYADEYTIDVLERMDRMRDLSFSQFDNDGPDGIPGSADDDGFVDYLALMPLTHQYDFFSENVAGIATLPINTYTTNDRDDTSRFTRIDGHSGCIASAVFGRDSIGVLVHEFIHSFDAPDLYDGSHENEEGESAGIGFWGVMGMGTLGWNWEGGPVSLSAYTRMLLGVIGPGNSELKDIYGIHRGIRISDVSQPGGSVYRIWLTSREYYLIEYRRNDGNYYDRDIPANGLLIWHIHEGSYRGNQNELLKLCDLEAADGRYDDAGYPEGTMNRPDTGRDNLDFYSTASWYRNRYAGNAGDATDVFDGVRYTSFGPYTNPNTKTSATNQQTGINIFNIRRDGDDMLFDVETAPFIDWSKLPLPLIGAGYNRFNDVYIINDLADVAPATVYLVTYESSGTVLEPDELVAVGDGGIAVIDLHEVEQSDIQALIEYSVFGGMSGAPSGILARQNITPEEYADVLAARGISDTGSADGRAPVRVQKVALTGTTETRPAEIVLDQNHPNPFNAATTITYHLTSAQPVTLEVYNILGQRAGTYVQGYRETGTHTITFSADGFASGVYLFRIAGETMSDTKKFMYLR